MRDYSDAGTLASLTRRMARRLCTEDAEGCRLWPTPSEAIDAPYTSYATAPRTSVRITVRRAAWCVLNAVPPRNIPSGVTITTCGKALCCTHVELVSQAEQIARKPPRPTRAVAATVRAEIVADAGRTSQVRLARRLGVSQKTVSKILRATA